MRAWKEGRRGQAHINPHAEIPTGKNTEMKQASSASKNGTLWPATESREAGDKGW